MSCNNHNAGFCANDRVGSGWACNDHHHYHNNSEEYFTYINFGFTPEMKYPQIPKKNKRSSNISSDCVDDYAQCGGAGCTGSTTCCTNGFTCQVDNQYWSGCKEAASPTTNTPTNTPTSTPIPAAPVPVVPYQGAMPAPLALLNASTAAPGYNITGYDQAYPKTNCDNTNQKFEPVCADSSVFDWDSFFKNSELRVIRLPIQPARIMKSMPSSAVDEPGWCSAFTNGDNTTGPSCPNQYSDTNDGGTTSDVGDYMGQLKAFLQNYPEKFFIIDVHNNSGSLDNPFNDSTSSFTQENFVWFWQLLSDYVNNYLGPELSSRVIFELYNEPHGGDFDNSAYAKAQCDIVNYIREKGYPQIVLLTTWGDYSGLHRWSEDGTTLRELVNAITGSLGLSAVNTGTLIVYHQYCDSATMGAAADYSGTANGCDENIFNNTIWNKWISDTKQIIGPNLGLCMTEGNVMVGDDVSPGNCVTGGTLYKDFLSDTTTVFGSQLKFFTLWQTNQWGAITGNPSSGIVKGNGKGFNYNQNYTCIYGDGSDDGSNGWVTSDGQTSLLNGQPIPNLSWGAPSS